MIENLNNININNILNLDYSILIQFGLNEESINLLKYVAKDLINLKKILNENKIECFYEFIISCESLCYNRAINMEDERFIENIINGIK